MKISTSILAFLIALCAYGQQNGRLILENANYLNLDSGSFVTGNILIEDGVIKKIDKEKISDSSAETIDASAYYTIPGLIDSHIHLFQSGAIYTRPDAVDLTAYKPYEEEREFLRENAGDLLKRYLRCGITSVTDIGGPMSNYTIRDQFKDNPNYPNLFITGPLVSTYQPPAFNIEDSPIIKVNNKEEAIALVQKQLPFNPDFIKIWGIAVPGVSTDEMYEIMKATADESKKNGLRVFVHATQLNTAKLAIKAGADVLVHSVNGPIDEEFAKMLKENDVTYIPTLVVSRNYSRTFASAFQPTKEDFQISNPFILGEIFDTEHLSDVPTFKVAKQDYPRMMESLKKVDRVTQINTDLITKQNNIIATGTDAGNVGTLHASSFYDEVAAMSESGLSNLHVLEASTLNGAKALGKSATLGSISEGKKADLVLLRKNPLEDLNNLKEVESVIKSGVVHKASEILKDTPDILAQRQLNAYNAGNIEAFLEPYSDDVEIYNFPNELSYKGKENMRSGYANFFKSNPDLHCELINRVVQGNTVIDHERVTGIKGGHILNAIAIYKIENGKITKVYFVD